MSAGSFKSMAEQVADHLRVQILSGIWKSKLPGAHRLAGELQVNFKTVLAAMAILEDEGLLSPQGAGRSRQVVLPKKLKSPALKLGFLEYSPQDLVSALHVGLRHRLNELGHHVKLAPKTLTELAMNPTRVANMVRRMDVDAWIVSAGSLEVLSWFASRELPTFAMFGRSIGLNLATVFPRKIPSMQEAVRHLVSLGHRRIVLMTAEERRYPHPALFEQAFLDELEANGIRPSRFNLPDWSNGKEGFLACLDSLFRITPPTALLLDEPTKYVSAMQHLARMGVVAPEKISMICMDPEPLFSWCEPSISHIQWDHTEVIERVVRWVRSLAGGKEDRERVFIESRFVPGGTVGPAPA